MATTLQDIARAAGVSVGSVSRILRGDPLFSDATTAKVKRTAEELSYRPNLLVRGMQTGRSHTVGVMIPPLGEYLGGIVCGIHDELSEAGFVPVLLWADTPADELAQIHRLVDRRVDAVILFPQEDSVPDTYLSEVWERSIPLATVDRKLLKTHADFAGTDDRLGGRLAAQHLLGLGHTRLCHLGANPTLSTSRERWEGFRDEAKQAGVEAQDVVVASFHDGLPAAAKLLRGADRPTAIFAGNDYLAASVLEAAAGLGLRVPQDLSVLGFADLTFAAMTRPRLSTIHQNPRGIGHAAARLVLDRVLGTRTDAKPARRLLEPTLVERDSTGPAPSS